MRKFENVLKESFSNAMEFLQITALFFFIPSRKCDACKQKQNAVDGDLKSASARRDGQFKGRLKTRRRK